MLFSKRTQEIKGSPTVMWDMRVRKFMLENPGVINLTVGQPDFDMPEYLKNSIEKSLETAGVNKYANPQGEENLRKLLVRFLKKSGNLNYSPEEVIWTSAKEALSLVLSALVDEGDEVVIITPCWPTYIDLVKYYGGKPVLVETNENFHLKCDAIESTITTRTKAIILNTPNNPTGAVYTQKELERLSEIILKKEIYAISDEVYRTIVFDGRVHKSISAFAGMKERTIVIDGFSKSLAVPGLRIGFAAGPEKIIKKMKELKSNVSGNSDSLLQFAMIHAFENHGEALGFFIEESRSSFEKRGRILSDALKKSGVEFVKPEGTFYIFVELPEKMKNSVEFAEVALNKGLGITPGVFFQKEGYARISFATSEEKIKKAAEILSKLYGSE